MIAFMLLVFLVFLSKRAEGQTIPPESKKVLVCEEVLTDESGGVFCKYEEKQSREKSDKD